MIHFQLPWFLFPFSFSFFPSLFFCFFLLFFFFLFFLFLFFFFLFFLYIKGGLHLEINYRIFCNLIQVSKKKEMEFKNANVLFIVSVQLITLQSSTDKRSKNQQIARQCVKRVIFYV